MLFVIGVSLLVGAWKVVYREFLELFTENSCLLHPKVREQTKQ